MSDGSCCGVQTVLRLPSQHRQQRFKPCMESSMCRDCLAFASVAEMHAVQHMLNYQKALI